MRVISLAHATALVQQTVKTAGNAAPYVIMCGAGVSAESIPTATEIIARCKSTYTANRVQFPGLPAPDDLSQAAMIDQYSYWLQQAYPNKRALAAFLCNIVDSAAIGSANFRLAHLLQCRSLARVVFTTNFDNLLTRALDLFGLTYTACDHPRTTHRIELGSDDLQIVHIHGTYRFYDCCNLRAQILERGEDKDVGSSSMQSLLRQALTQTSALVIGYSGWEQDVFMTTLRRRLVDPLPYQLLWFCYSAEDRDSLPSWLSDHEDVMLVVAEQFLTAGVTNLSEIQRREAGTDVPRLSAAQVLEALIIGLSIGPPSITVDPLAFYSERLRAAIGQSELGGDAGGGVYSLLGVANVIEHARQLAHSADVGPHVSLLEQLRQGLRESDYAKVAFAARSILPSLALLDHDGSLEVLSAASRASDALRQSGSNEKESAAETVVSIATHILRVREDTAARSILAANLYRGVLYVAYSDRAYAASSEALALWTEFHLPTEGIWYYGIKRWQASTSPEPVAAMIELARGIAKELDHNYAPSAYVRTLTDAAEMVQHNSWEKADELLESAISAVNKLGDDDANFWAIFAWDLRLEHAIYASEPHLIRHYVSQYCKFILDKSMSGQDKVRSTNIFFITLLSTVELIPSEALAAVEEIVARVPEVERDVAAASRALAIRVRALYMLGRRVEAIEGHSSFAQQYAESRTPEAQSTLARLSEWLRRREAEH